MKRDGVRKMRGKAKQRVSLILVVTMVLGTVLTGNTVFAAGESSDEQDRIKINISKDSEQTVEQNVTQTIHVTAQGQCSQSVWGNFQNFDGSMFKEIAGTMNLFGYDKDKTDLYKKFFYENNSMWGRDGESLKISDDSPLNGQNATQGLVADQLSSNNLQLKTNNENTITAPFFDKDFLSGKNSKNTVLGKVYENVTFPFVKKAMTSSSENSDGTVDYWYFDSADQNSDIDNK